MNQAGSYILEATLTAVVLAWILTNAKGFNDIVNAVGGTAVTATQALWAR